MDRPSQRRRSQKRLPTYDYTAPGPYWVTIRLHRPRPLFGSVDDEGMHLSDIGVMVDETWQSLPERFPSVVLDAWIVMPDHFHGLLALFEGPDPPANVSLGRVIGAFKSLSTTRYIAGVREAGWPPYDRYFWLEDYYEHIVRDDRDLAAKRLYIERNPWRWLAKRRSEG